LHSCIEKARAARLNGRTNSFRQGCVINIMSSLSHALKLHGDGRLDEARQAYLDILAHAPDADGALHYLGILEHQCGRSESGLDLLARALDLAAPQADRLNDLGNVLTELERLEEAVAAFAVAAELEPGDANYSNNLGAVLMRLERLPEALAAFQQALAGDPAFVPALNNLGDLYSRQHQADEAAEYYCRAYVTGPLHDKPKRMLGIAYYTLNRIEEAAAVYRAWVAEEPHNPIARHLLAACSGEDVPGRAEDAFVEAVFDEYADNFDSKLVKSLGYRGPEYIAAALERHLPGARGLRVLDGGCGTGLCGPVLAPYAGHLAGIDLSANMLAPRRRARALPRARESRTRRMAVVARRCLRSHRHRRRADLLRRAGRSVRGRRPRADAGRTDDIHLGDPRRRQAVAAFRNQAQRPLRPRAGLCRRDLGGPGFRVAHQSRGGAARGIHAAGGGPGGQRAARERQ
jgi:predicted TPR repeat methyltransferase